MKKVSDEEFLAAYENEENQKIMSCVSVKYKRYMDKDTLESNKRLAMLMSLQRFDGKKSNFKTFLWNGFRQQLLSSVRKNVKYNKKKVIYSGHCANYPKCVKSAEGLIDLVDTINSINNGNILIERYVNNESTEELAKKYGVTKAAIFNRIKNAKKELKDILFGV